MPGSVRSSRNVDQLDDATGSQIGSQHALQHVNHAAPFAAQAQPGAELDGSDRQGVAAAPPADKSVIKKLLEDVMRTGA